jgi:hypothetical protein
MKFCDSGVEVARNKIATFSFSLQDWNINESQKEQWLNSQYLDVNSVDPDHPIPAIPSADETIS